MLIHESLTKYKLYNKMFISRRGTRRACDLQRKKVFASEHFTIRIQSKTLDPHINRVQKIIKDRKTP